MAGPERAKILLLGIAAWTELEAAVSRIVAATLRDDGQTVEEIRVTAHELLDHHIDLKIEGIGAIRRDLERKERGR